MKLKLRIAVTVAVLTVIAGAASAVTAQMVGGYKTVEATDQYARAAAEWAVRERGEKTETGIELLSLVKAERQTVQGANYRLCMKINTEGQDEPVSFAQAVVYMGSSRKSTSSLAGPPIRTAARLLPRRRDRQPWADLSPSRLPMRGHVLLPNGRSRTGRKNRNGYRADVARKSRAAGGAGYELPFLHEDKHGGRG